MRYLTDYLFEDTFVDYDYAKGIEHFKKFKMAPQACSAVRKGNIIGRNLDWYYDEAVDFIVHTHHHQNRYATIGVAHTGEGVTSKALRDGNVPDALYEMIPFSMSDCLNEKGLYCSMNVVPVGDKSNTTPIGSEGPEICQLMLPRYLCDFADSVDSAIALLHKIIIFAPLNGIQSECHLMLSDPNKQVIIEFVNGEIKMIEANIITNFYLDGWNGEIASAALGNTEEEIAATGLTDHAMGLERYKIITDGYEAVETVDDMSALMESVRYTRSYDLDVSPFWYSEFYGETETFGNLTIYSSAEEMQPIRDYSIEHFNPSKRDGQSWNTCHTSIYDIENKTLRVYSQENYSNPFEFSLQNQRYGILGLDLLKPESRRV